MTDDIQTDDVVFSQDELDELKKHGIDNDELDDIVQTVHDELSDNASLKNQHRLYRHLSFVPLDGVHTPMVLVYRTANFYQSVNDAKCISVKNNKVQSQIPINQANQIATSVDHSQASAQPVQADNMSASDDVDDDRQKQADIVRTLIAKKHSQKTIDHKSVRIGIEAGALPTKMFFVMNGLSAVIAGYGLLANSPAVVIGAMLVAMMLGPITGTALAVIDARLTLLRQSLITLIGGVLIIYAVGMLLGFLYPQNVTTAEIISRTSPTTMDLMVALAGGAAGAYAMISPNLSVAVVGVAVATALVPPLTASGILLSAGHWQLAMGAWLLAITNMLAIQFTNALVLWFAGFRRVLDDDTHKWGQVGIFLKRNSAVLLLLIGIGGYLSINFKHAITQQNFEHKATALIEQNIEHQTNYLVSTSFTQEDEMTVVRAIIQGIDAPDSRQVSLLEQDIQALADDSYEGSVIKVQIRFVPEVIVQSTPVTKSELKPSAGDTSLTHQ